MHHGGDAGAAKSSQGTEAGAPGSQQPVYSAPAQFGAPRYVVPSGLSQAQAVSMSSLMPPQMMQARGGVYPAAAPGATRRDAGPGRRQAWRRRKRQLHVHVIHTELPPLRVT